MIKKELEKYFTSDKSSWIIESNGDNQIWDIEKVEEFWFNIREYKMKNQDFNFDFYCFPPNKLNNKCNFFSVDDKREFDKMVFFDNAKFQGNISFEGIDFIEDVSFEEAQFKQLLKIFFSTFHSRLYLNGIAFYKRFICFNVNFESEFFMREISSISYIGFEGVQFKGGFELSLSNIQGDFLLSENTFYKNSEFQYSDIDGRFIFRRNNILENNFTFSKLTFTDKSSVEFHNIEINDKYIFKGVNMKQVSFIDSDISTTTFSNCYWNYSNRLHLNKSLESNKTFGKNNDNLRNLENTYRQLKRNFEKIKNYELSGYSYVSEMEMRKLRLFKERKYYTWFIYWFYGFFSGYTQDIKRPVTSLFGLILISTLIYFILDPNLSSALQRGINGCFPYLKIQQGEEAFTGYLLIPRNIQFLLGSIFITFFILALRKRFKQ